MCFRFSGQDVDALIVERDRLRGELERAQQEITEWEALVGQPFLAALNAAVARVDGRRPYALTEAYELLGGAFHQMAESRNMWRARARKAEGR